MPATTPEIRKMRLADLELAAYNPRTIEDANFAGLRASLAEFGMMEMPVVNTAEGKQRVVSGHQRIKGLLAEGYTHADCLCVEFDEAMERAANIAMNNPAIRGRWDVQKAIPMLDEIAAQRGNGTDPLALDRLRKSIKVQASRDPKQMPANQPKEEAPAVSQAGEVYELGQHWLACGDARDTDLIDRVRGSAGFGACITDPPFGVAYKRDGEAVDLDNDALHGGAWVAFLHAIAGVAMHNTDGPCYVFSSSKHLPDFADAWKAEGGVIHQWLAWCKTNPVVFVTRQTDFHPQFEWMLYGCANGVDLSIPETPRTNVLTYPKPARNKLHPTQKPLDLIASLVADTSGIVFDPFAGSGTTLIACQDASRECVAVEIDPQWCDVIRQRWAEHVHGADVEWQSLTPVAADV